MTLVTRKQLIAITEVVKDRFPNLTVKEALGISEAIADAIDANPPEIAKTGHAPTDNFVKALGKATEAIKKL